MDFGGAASNSNQDMLKQASHIWSMLDEMADSDPNAYKKFIKKTMEDGEKIILPKPFACVESALVSPKKSVLYINICSWEQVPKPKTDEDTVSVASGPIEQHKDQAGEHSTVRLAFHPFVLDESFKNDVDKDLLINLGMEYMEQHHKVKVSRKYKLCQGLKFKGDIQSLASSSRFFGKREKTQEEVVQENLADLSPDSLLGKIHQLSSEEGMARPELEARLRDLAFSSNDATGASGGKKGGLIEEVGNKKGGLIKDVSSTKAANSNDRTKMDGPKKGLNEEVRNTSSNNPSNASAQTQKGLIEEVSSTTVELPSPKYVLDLLEADEKGKRRLELRINLDGVQSVADCELDISEEEVNLYVESKYELSLPLPEATIESEAKAKFNKKKAVLLVTLPTQSVS